MSCSRCAEHLPLGLAPLGSALRGSRGKRRNTKASTLLTKPRCSICRHPERLRIEMYRLQGMSLDSIAEKFNLGAGGRDALWRHMKNHVSDDEKAMMLADVPIAEAAARAAEEGVSLLDYLALIRSSLLQQVRLAATVNDRHGLAAVSGKAIDCLREIGKLTGQLKGMGPSTVINNNLTLMASPAFAELQQSLIRALAPYPRPWQQLSVPYGNWRPRLSKALPRSP